MLLCSFVCSLVSCCEGLRVRAGVYLLIALCCTMIMCRLYMLERVVCRSMLPVCACIQLKCLVSWGV